MNGITGTRCLVSGAAGFIGSHITDLLVAAGAAEVVALDDLSSGRLSNLDTAMASGRVSFTEGDIRDKQLVKRLVTGIDLVFHQAAIKILRCVTDPQLALDVIAAGTFNVAEAAADAGVRKVVAASSASVYGLATQFPTSEEHHPYGNETFYGAAKCFTEGMLRSLHASRGLDYVALRYFNVYGPRMDIHGAYTEVLPRWLDRIAEGLPPLIDGDGSNTRDFTYVTDVARANLLAAASDVTDKALNVGSGTETSLSELASLLIQVTGSDTLLPVHGPQRAADPVPRRCADITAARKELGWEPEVSLEAGLRELVSWRRQVTP